VNYSVEEKEFICDISVQFFMEEMPWAVSGEES
jgi:hypothetical protein